MLQVLLNHGISKQQLEAETEACLATVEDLQATDAGVNSVLVASAAAEIAQLRSSCDEQAAQLQQMHSR